MNILDYTDHENLAESTCELNLFTCRQKIINVSPNDIFQSTNDISTLTLLPSWFFQDIISTSIWKEVET